MPSCPVEFLHVLPLGARRPVAQLNFKFAGRGQRDTPVGDVYTAVELIMFGVVGVLNFSTVCLCSCSVARAPGRS